MTPKAPSLTDPVAIEADRLTLKNMAASAFEASMAFGISRDNFERLASKVSRHYLDRIAELEKDARRLDVLEQLILESRTGASVDFVRFVEDGLVTEKGFRLSTFHNLRGRQPSLRAAIDAAIKDQS